MLNNRFVSVGVKYEGSSANFNCVKSFDVKADLHFMSPESGGTAINAPTTKPIPPIAVAEKICSFDLVVFPAADFRPPQNGRQRIFPAAGEGCATCAGLWL